MCRNMKNAWERREKSNMLLECKSKQIEKLALLLKEMGSPWKVSDEVSYTT